MHKRTHGSAADGRPPSPRSLSPKKRHNRKRRDWHRLIRRACAVALLAEIAVALFANPYLRVTKVRVEGLQTLSAQQVFREARVPARTNLFWMALRQPFARRLAADPVIERAERTIRLPDTLVLTVTERQPYATLEYGGDYWLLDRHGVPYRALEKPRPDIPLLEAEAPLPGEGIALGRPVRAAWLRDAYKLMALLAAEKNLAVTEIKVDQNANLCLNNRDNLQIRLGQPDFLPQKVTLAQATVAAYGGEIARRAAYIDISCPEQPVWMPRVEAHGQKRRYGPLSNLASP